jgi:hypothetical protein
MYAPRGGGRAAPDAGGGVPGGSGGAGGGAPGEGGLLAGAARRASWETSEHIVEELERLARSRRGSGSSGYGAPSAGAACALAPAAAPAPLGLPPAPPPASAAPLVALRAQPQWTLLPGSGAQPGGAAAAAATAAAPAAPAAAAPAGAAPPGWQKSYAISTVLVAHVTNLKRATRKLDPEDELMAYHQVTAALDRVLSPERDTIWKVARFEVRRRVRRAWSARARTPAHGAPSAGSPSPRTAAATARLFSPSPCSCPTTARCALPRAATSTRTRSSASRCACSPPRAQ